MQAVNPAHYARKKGGVSPSRISRKSLLDFSAEMCYNMYEYPSNTENTKCSPTVLHSPAKVVYIGEESEVRANG